LLFLECFEGGTYALQISLVVLLAVIAIFPADADDERW
jgi:hypothetical protein